ncbi:MAG: class I SAM-dependent methyltransferase [Isosphaeraceae bacterium]|nr:class I SAM-dependent methyltransferase [Isosphaeraceae bacterium]
MWSRWYRSHWPSLPPERRSEGGQPVSQAKFREIAEIIIRLADIQPEDRVLDLGCSIGAITYYLSRRCHSIVGVDFIEDSLAFARENYNAPNVEYVCADLATFATNDLFDCIVMNNVVHMLDSWSIAKRLLCHCYSRLRPSGRLYLGEVPDTRKTWRYATVGRQGLRCYAHRLLPGWSFPILSKVRGRPMGKVLWFNRARLARILGCSAERIAVHDQPGTLLNPVERSHFVVVAPPAMR